MEKMFRKAFLKPARMLIGVLYDASMYSVFWWK
jgi:hypothetical protein